MLQHQQPVVEELVDRRVRDGADDSAHGRYAFCVDGAPARRHASNRAARPIAAGNHGRSASARRDERRRQHAHSATNRLRGSVVRPATSTNPTISSNPAQHPNMAPRKRSTNPSPAARITRASGHGDDRADDERRDEDRRRTRSGSAPPDSPESRASTRRRTGANAIAPTKPDDPRDQRDQLAHTPRTNANSDRQHRDRPRAIGAGRTAVTGACERPHRAGATMPSGPRPSACRATLLRGVARRVRPDAHAPQRAAARRRAARCTRDSPPPLQRLASAFAPLSSENAASWTTKPSFGAPSVAGGGDASAGALRLGFRVRFASPRLCLGSAFGGARCGLGLRLAMGLRRLRAGGPCGAGRRCLPSTALRPSSARAMLRAPALRVADVGALDVAGAAAPLSAAICVSYFGGLALGDTTAFSASVHRLARERVGCRVLARLLRRRSVFGAASESRLTNLPSSTCGILTATLSPSGLGSLSSSIGTMTAAASASTIAPTRRRRARRRSSSTLMSARISHETPVRCGSRAGAMRARAPRRR